MKINTTIMFIINTRKKKYLQNNYSKFAIIRKIIIKMNITNDEYYSDEEAHSFPNDKFYFAKLYSIINVLVIALGILGK